MVQEHQREVQQEKENGGRQNADADAEQRQGGDAQPTEAPPTTGVPRTQGDPLSAGTEPNE